MKLAVTTSSGRNYAQEKKQTPQKIKGKYSRKQTSSGTFVRYFVPSCTCNKPISRDSLPKMASATERLVSVYKIKESRSLVKSIGVKKSKNHILKARSDLNC